MRAQPRSGGPRTSTSGRGPTRLISPLSTFQTCGSSSRLVRRSKRPTRVTRGSSLQQQPVRVACSRPSSSSTMLLGAVDHRPELQDREARLPPPDALLAKEHRPGESSLIATAISRQQRRARRAAVPASRRCPWPRLSAREERAEHRRVDRRRRSSPRRCRPRPRAPSRRMAGAPRDLDAELPRAADQLKSSSSRTSPARRRSGRCRARRRRRDSRSAMSPSRRTEERRSLPSPACMARGARPAPPASPRTRGGRRACPPATAIAASSPTSKTRSGPSRRRIDAARGRAACQRERPAAAAEHTGCA